MLAGVFFPISHAPVLMPLSGETHGAHFSSAAQTSSGRRLAYCATCGTQTLRQTPAAPLSDLQTGSGAPPVLMMASGTQAPPLQVASALSGVPGEIRRGDAVRGAGERA